MRDTVADMLNRTTWQFLKVFSYDSTCDGTTRPREQRSGSGRYVSASNICHLWGSATYLGKGLLVLVCVISYILELKMVYTLTDRSIASTRRFVVLIIDLAAFSAGVRTDNASTPLTRVRAA